MFAIFPYWFSRPLFSKSTSFKITMIWKYIKLLIHPCKLDYFTIRYIVQILVFIFNPYVIGNRINFVKHFIGIIDSSFEYDTSTCNSRWRTNGLEIETSQIYRTRRSFGMIEGDHYFNAGLVFKGHWFQLFYLLKWQVLHVYMAIF